MEILNLKEQRKEAIEEAKRRGLERFEEALEAVKPIIRDVRDQGDEAIKNYEKKFTKIPCDMKLKYRERR
ncbi:MAG: hypothetical protein ACXQTI_06250 [Candidatus Nezhaarchaeales archaeon]